MRCPVWLANLRIRAKPCRGGLAGDYGLDVVPGWTVARVNRENSGEITPYEVDTYRLVKCYLRNSGDLEHVPFLEFVNIRPPRSQFGAAMGPVLRQVRWMVHNDVIRL